VLAILGPCRRADRAQRASRKRRLEQIRRVRGAGRAARADQCVRLVDKENHWPRGRLHFVDHLPQPVFELALHAGAGLQQPDIQGAHHHVLERRRHVATRDPQRKALDNGSLADARLAHQHGVVLAAAHEYVDELANLAVAPDHRIEPALARLGAQIDCELLQRLLSAHLRRRNRAAVLARRGRRPQTETVGRLEAVFRRSRDDLTERIRQRLRLHFGEFGGQRVQRVAQMARAQRADEQIARANLSLAEHQRGEDPGALDGFLHVGGEIADRRIAARQTLERRGQIASEIRRVHVEVPDDTVQVGVLQLQDLMHPMRHLDVRVAAQFAKHGGAFDAPVGKRIELAEQRAATDLGHGGDPFK